MKQNGTSGRAELPRPWSVERWGRLIAGLSMFSFTALGACHHPWWLLGTLVAAANLIATSLVDRCVLHDLLIRLGARDREDLFEPGGGVRPEIRQSTQKNKGFQHALWPRLWFKRVGEKLRPPRVHAFEFCDQSWLKGFWRETYMEGLNLLCRLGRLDRMVGPSVLKWAAASGPGPILDLASGNGEVVASIIEEARRQKVCPLKFVLSDLYPDLDGFRNLQQRYPQSVTFLSGSTDATALASILSESGSIPQPRSIHICAGFHHFRPQQAAQVMQWSARNMNGIFISEYFERSWRALMTPFISLLPLMLLPFLSGRFSLKKVGVTTLIPIVPLMIVWDGLVSILRVYRPEELEAMVPEESKKDWRWESEGRPYWLIHRSLCFFGIRIGKKKRTKSTPASGTREPARLAIGVV